MNYKYLNLFAGEVQYAWKDFFLYISVICFHNYLALLKTTQWWFRWQKTAPDWLWGGLVHLNLWIVWIPSTSWTELDIVWIISNSWTESDIMWIPSYIWTESDIVSVLSNCLTESDIVWIPSNTWKESYIVCLLSNSWTDSGVVWILLLRRSYF